MAFEISRLRLGEKVAAVAGTLLFILMLFDWYDVGPVGFSAWEAFGLIDLYLFLVIVAAIALAILTATERSPALPVTASVIVTALAALGTLLVLYRLIDAPDISNETLGVTVRIDLDPTIWAFLGLVAVTAIAYGGYLSMREEGTTFSDARDQARAAFDDVASRREETSGTSAPPPAASETTYPSESTFPGGSDPAEPPASSAPAGGSPPSSTA